MCTKILLLPGDGIGPEVIREAVRVLEFFREKTSFWFESDSDVIGGAAFDRDGSPLPERVAEKARAADAVFLGAVGGPRWDKVDFALRPEAGLLGIRKAMGLFANLRPALVFPSLAGASSLKREFVEGLDLLIVRELIGGIYFGLPSGVREAETEGERVGTDTMTYRTSEIRRIGRLAFELAALRAGRLCSVDKANVLSSSRLWREEIIRLGQEEFPSLELSHLYVDNAAMQLIRNPRQIDVLVTGNLFGDILSDCAAELTGSIGMLPSASLGEKKPDGRQAALYEPVHGSAPDIAGKSIANPLAAILSAGMMFRYSLQDKDRADRIDTAVKTVLEQGLRTADIARPGEPSVGTREMGDAVIRALGSRL